MILFMRLPDAYTLISVKEVMSPLQLITRIHKLLPF
jgi:hypothetical protein